MHPFIYITNQRQVVRIKDCALQNIRTYDRKKWEYNTSSTKFRNTIGKCLDTVQSDKTAFKPDPQVEIDHWDGMEAFRNEGDFRTRWVHMLSFDNEWDVTPVNEHVGNRLYENRPFQMVHE